MSSCKKCNGRGFIETYHAGSASYTPIIQQCCDITAYAREVQKRLSNPRHVTDAPVLQPQLVNRIAQVIPFRRQDDGRTS